MAESLKKKMCGKEDNMRKHFEKCSGKNEETPEPLTVTKSICIVLESDSEDKDIVNTAVPLPSTSKEPDPGWPKTMRRKYNDFSQAKMDVFVTKVTLEFKQKIDWKIPEFLCACNILLLNIQLFKQ